MSTQIGNLVPISNGFIPEWSFLANSLSWESIYEDPQPAKVAGKNKKVEIKQAPNPGVAQPAAAQPDTKAPEKKK